MKSTGLIPIQRGVWHALETVIKWSQGADGRIAVFLDGSKEPVLTAMGPNMHNGYHHYLKLGMYRHPEIATENRLGIRDVSIEHLAAWPESATAAGSGLAISRPFHLGFTRWPADLGHSDRCLEHSRAG